MKYVKIYGARNSGTIFLEWLIGKNLDVKNLDTYDLGWKHRVAPSEDELTGKMKEDVIFLCLVKNPYSWLLSMHKRPYHHESLRNLSFKDFIKYSYGDYRNPAVMWNTKNGSYFKLKDFVKNLEIIKYEDILKDPNKTLDNLSEKYGLEKPAFYKSINNLLTNKHGIKHQKFHKEYYLHERWRMKLRPEHIEQINKFLDKELMEKLNYTIL
ncbi:MAG: hypothetical protein K8R86_02760 [Bacteroidales bacterium]|nr:hypothetical protein [Bacteroidales bacterium]